MEVIRCSLKQESVVHIQKVNYVGIIEVGLLLENCDISFINKCRLNKSLVAQVKKVC